MVLIEDGTGFGYRAKIDSNNKLNVDAITKTEEHWANHNNGNAYTLVATATPTGAGDCFLYFKNTSDDDLIIEGFWTKLAANEYIDIKIGDAGTPSGGTSSTPGNLNSGSANSAEGTFQYGNDITGLSGGTTIYRIYHASSNESQYRNFNEDVVLKKNGVMTIYVQTGTTQIDVVIPFYYVAAI